MHELIRSAVAFLRHAARWRADEDYSSGAYVAAKGDAVER